MKYIIATTNATIINIIIIIIGSLLVDLVDVTVSLEPLIFDIVTK